MAPRPVELIAATLALAWILLSGCSQQPTLVQVPIPVEARQVAIPAPPPILSTPISEQDDPVAQCVLRLKAALLYQSSLLELLK